MRYLVATVATVVLLIGALGLVAGWERELEFSRALSSGERVAYKVVRIGANGSELPLGNLAVGSTIMVRVQNMSDEPIRSVSFGCYMVAPPSALDFVPGMRGFAYRRRLEANELGTRPFGPGAIVNAAIERSFDADQLKRMACRTVALNSAAEPVSTWSRASGSVAKISDQASHLLVSMISRSSPPPPPADAQARLSVAESSRTNIAAAASSPPFVSTGTPLPSTAPARAPSQDGSVVAQFDRVIADQLRYCWRPGPKSAYVPQVTVELGRDGSFASPPVLLNPSSDRFEGLSAKAALDALTRCEPFDIPSEFAASFESWHRRVLRFDQAAGVSSATASAPARMTPAEWGRLDGLMQQQYKQCWSYLGEGIPSGYIPQIRVSYNADGSLAAQPRLLNPPADPVLRKLADSALRAVRRCNPLTVPPEFAPYYVQWKERILKFDPAEMAPDPAPEAAPATPDHLAPTTAPVVAQVAPAPAPAVANREQVTLGAATRGAFLMQKQSNPRETETYPATTTWTADLVDGVPQKIVGEMTTLDTGLRVRMTLVPNTKPDLDANVVGDVEFFHEGGTGITKIDTPQPRRENVPSGDTLDGIARSVTADRFLFALSRSGASKNRRTIEDGTWLDVPVLLSDKRIGKITMEMPGAAPGWHKATESWLK